MDLPAHHPERPARHDAAPVRVASGDRVPVTDARPRPAFAHASEAELARILDFYDVAWEYEPHTFPILYDRDGAVLESFSPDFYLPDLDLYIELTTLKQRLVRKKNRKLRRLRDLYPGPAGEAALCARLPGAAPQVRADRLRRRPQRGRGPVDAAPARRPCGAARAIRRRVRGTRPLRGDGRTRAPAPTAARARRARRRARRPAPALPPAPPPPPAPR